MVHSREDITDLADLELTRSGRHLQTDAMLGVWDLVLSPLLGLLLLGLSDDEALTDQTVYHVHGADVLVLVRRMGGRLRTESSRNDSFELFGSDHALDYSNSIGYV
jgi:hypothetical protein